MNSDIYIYVFIFSPLSTHNAIKIAISLAKFFKQSFYCLKISLSVGLLYSIQKKKDINLSVQVNIQIMFPPQPLSIRGRVDISAENDQQICQSKSDHKKATRQELRKQFNLKCGGLNVGRLGRSKSGNPVI